jgi:AraC-like DNA-binding protein
VRYVRQESGDGCWEMWLGEPAPRLRGVVRGYCGYHERTVAPTRRWELPGPQVVLIVDLGPTLRVGGERHTSGFVAGLDDASTLTETVGEQRGVQVDLELTGAAAVLGMPIAEVAGQVVALDEVLGRVEVERLRERLMATGEWARRFALLDAFFGARVRAVEEDWLTVAYRRLVESGGTVGVEALAEQLGYSRKHVSVSFRERFGMAPKALARVIRFDRAVKKLRAGGYGSLAQLAVECGYFDQAHFIRDFRAMAGETPGGYANPWPG